MAIYSGVPAADRNSGVDMLQSVQQETQAQNVAMPGMLHA